MDWTTIPTELPFPAGVALAVGVLLLSAGWLLYWLSINATGALLLGATGLLLGEGLSRLMGLEGPATVAMMAGGAIAGAITGAILARLIHALLFFFTGVGVGAAVFFSITTALRKAHPPDQWFASDEFFSFGLPVAGVLTGIVFVALSSWVVILATSLLGATLISAGLDWPLNGLLIPPLALVGIVLQAFLTKSKREKSGQEDEEEG